ncbi:glycosyltransferase family 39 protein [Gigaspora margarita]|uniref:Dolichyl-phosphate-mannose--protein mannosyltransferase n=1 Tax=Gigaspora margarita TaxID=4874 RepID=A0A8H3X3E7_GIGMA|nr:glycosyltransferase family 39 protein [Gigaspora margarita]
MDTLKRRHFTTTINQQQFSKSGYEQVPLDPIDFDENGKLYKPLRLPENKILAFWQQYNDILIPAFFTVLSFWTRFYLISYSSFVVWDEAHFGKFGSHYLKREFYFDVHPPLGKMLVGLAGLLAGYNGSFEFGSGEAYPADVNYAFMRIFFATFGAWMVPLAYFTAIELDFSQHAVILATLMVLLDTAYLCISRFILLDSMLLFFTFTTLFFLTKFHNQRNDPFSIDWWLWLILTGMSIGCVTSVKWVGLFVTALVGLYTIEDLWDKFGDLSMPKTVYLKHWIARIVCLIILPIQIYMLCFAIHFAILNKSGPGDAQMSSLFQAGLRGNNFYGNPIDLAYGSKFTLKNMGYGGGLLHSHVQTYPSGSKQQQVTCYHHRDSNNEWFIKKMREENEENEEENNSTDVEFVKHNDIVRLVHSSTCRNLHSHHVNAPVTKSQYEVSCYGNEQLGDQNDYWIIEVVDDLLENTPRIRVMTTRLRFRHKTLGCYLRAANAVLPQWGFKQVEVTCDKNNNPSDSHTYWNLEHHWNDKLPAGGSAHYRTLFLHDFWHLNVAMYTSNNALIPDPDKEDILASNPWQWPLLQVGIRICGWDDKAVKYYLLGNPIIWWSGTASLVTFVFLFVWHLIRRQRQFHDFSQAQWTHFLYVGKICLIGWLLHFMPFFIMGRVTYLHHYFPALYFSILMCAFVLDQLTSSCNQITKHIVFGISYLAVILVFWYFKDIAFGFDYPSSELKGRQWLSSWNLVD